MTGSTSRTPLLVPVGNEGEFKEQGYEVIEEEDNVTPSRTWPEAKRVLSLAVPISLSEVVSFFAYLITTAQVGRLGSLELSALTLARSVFHVTGLSLVVGVSSAVETFCGQAYGARQFPVLGLVLQRAALLCLLTCVLPLALWTRAEWLMALLGQAPEVIPLAASYLRLLGPSLCLWAVSGCIKAYLSSQGVVTPLTVVATVYTALIPLANYFFMFQLGLGMVGAAVAYNVMQALELAMLLASMAYLHFCRQTGDDRTWAGFSRLAFKGWGEYMRVAVPSAAAICLDWWTYEAVVIVAGVLPDANVQLGAMGIAFNTHALLFMVVDGFSAAASTRVSNELGAGRGHCARFASLVAVCLGVAAPLAASAGLLAAPRAWTRLYTADRAIVNLVARLMPVLTVSNLADSVACVLSGVLRGSGRQELAFRVNLGAYWLLGLPCAALLALRYHEGAMGLWLAMGAASALQAIILVGCVMRFDWSHEAHKALLRVAATHGSADWRVLAGGRPGAPPGGDAGEDDVAGAAEAGEAETGAGYGALGEGDEDTCAEEGVLPVPAVVLHAGVGSRHGVHEPLLTAEHTI